MLNFTKTIFFLFILNLAAASHVLSSVSDDSNPDEDSSIERTVTLLNESNTWYEDRYIQEQKGKYDTNLRVWLFFSDIELVSPDLTSDSDTPTLDFWHAETLIMPTLGEKITIKIPNGSARYAYYFINCKGIMMCARHGFYKLQTEDDNPWGSLTFRVQKSFFFPVDIQYPKETITKVEPSTYSPEVFEAYIEPNL